MTTVGTAFLFMFIWIVGAFVLLYLNISKRGRNLGVNIGFGEIVEDLGVLKEIKIKFGYTQQTRLLKCQNKGETFYVLETTDKSFR